MIDKDFYKNIGPFSLDEIASKVDASVLGNGDKKILDIASLEDASETEISFYNSVKYRHHLEKTKAGVLVVDKSFKIKPENEYLVVDDPYVTIAKIASMFYPDCEYQRFYFDEDDLINSSEKPKKCSQNVFEQLLIFWLNVSRGDVMRQAIFRRRKMPDFFMRL